ncbi:MAG: ABC transporter permease [Bryobacteraceae bacterium]|nr:ABC transporter permease [Bryobacteraceae bacterium]
MTALWADLKFAIRTLSRSPMFTAIAVLSLALGIGANTAIFTLLDQLILRLLPVKDPEALVMVWATGNHSGSNSGTRMMSYPMYQDFQQKGAPFGEVFSRRTMQYSFAVDNSTELVEGEIVSGSYFGALGVGPALGRVIGPEDDKVWKGHPVAVLSYEYWQRRFAGARDVIGKKVLINNYPFTVVGVSAKGFEGMDPARTIAVRIPMQMMPVVGAEWWSLGERRSRFVQTFARLKPGYTAESAQAAITPLFKQILNDEVKMPAFKNSTPFQRARFLEMKINVERAATGFSNLRRSFSQALIVLMAMVGLVLLIACSNVANLLIARAVARQKEIAVRLSVGASRGQLVRQLLVESVLLAVAGGVLGIALAYWTTSALLNMLPNDGGAPLMLSPRPDLRILGFSIALSVLTGLIFGLIPAFRSTKLDLWGTLKDAVGAIAGGGQSVLLRKGLVTAQVGLSFLLLFGAGLFIKSLQNLKTTDTGFQQPENLITFQVDVSRAGYSAERSKQFFRDLLANIRAVPGVAAAGHASVELLAGNEWDSTMGVEGHTPKDGEDMQAFVNRVSSGYFAAMGVKFIEGRDFDDRDFNKEATVVIVNRKFAKHFFGDKPAVGRKVGWGINAGSKLNLEIIGVTEDTLYEGPREGVRRQVFLAAIQSGGADSAAFYVRAARDTKSLYAAMRAEVKKLDPQLPLWDLKTLANELDQTLLTERLIALLATAFGALATLLAAIGLYGVMAFVVTRRTKEIGLRMALGASQASVLWNVMREVLSLVAIGLAIGIPAALAAGRFVERQLFGMKSTDWGVGLAASGILLVVAALAGFIPARRASTIDPMIALRYD